MNITNHLNQIDLPFKGFLAILDNNINNLFKADYRFKLKTFFKSEIPLLKKSKMICGGLKASIIKMEYNYYIHFMEIIKILEASDNILPNIQLNINILELKDLEKLTKISDLMIKKVMEANEDQLNLFPFK